MPLGSFTLVLHAHSPYVRRTNEARLFRAIAETYLPLLIALDELQREGLTPRLTLACSPLWLEQLADTELQTRFELYLEEQLALVETLHAAPASLQTWYRDWHTRLLRAYRDDYARDLIGGLKRLAADDALDLLTSAATHAYLPLCDRDATIYAQLKLGIAATRRHFGHNPRGVWLPACGYRPAFMDGTHYKPGIEEFLAELNLGYFFCDANGIADSRAPGNVPARKIVVRADERPVAKFRTTLRPYYVQAANVAVFARNPHASLQVIGQAHAYPNDFVYRDPARADPATGLRLWRLTASNATSAQKELYDPAIAWARTRMHAEHFVSVVAQQIRTHHFQGFKPGIVTAAFDAEIFGVRWFEGIAWLKEVLRQCATSPDVELTTARAYVRAYPPDHMLALPESSWGKHNDHSTWANAHTAWMWDALNAAAREMESLVAQFSNATGERQAILTQAARELLLLQTSDWVVGVGEPATQDDANEPFRQHHARFTRLAALARRDAWSDEERRYVAHVAALDQPFADLDYRLFAARE